MRKVLRVLLPLKVEFPSARNEYLAYPVIELALATRSQLRVLYGRRSLGSDALALVPCQLHVGNYFALGQVFEEESSAEAEGSPLTRLRPGEPLHYIKLNGSLNTHCGPHFMGPILPFKSRYSLHITHTHSTICRA